MLPGVIASAVMLGWLGLQVVDVSRGGRDRVEFALREPVTVAMSDGEQLDIYIRTGVEFVDFDWVPNDYTCLSSDPSLVIGPAYKRISYEFIDGDNRWMRVARLTATTGGVYTVTCPEGRFDEPLAIASTDRGRDELEGVGWALLIVAFGIGTVGTLVTLVVVLISGRRWWSHPQEHVEQPSHTSS